MGKRAKDLTGDVYNKLTVMSYTGTKYVDGDKLYSCDCSCGTTLVVRSFSLRHGKVKSCRSCSSKNKHGYSNKPVYKLWARLKNRCGKDVGYEHMTYPDKWETFIGFWEDMGATHFDGASIDRIDNDRSYSKENCQWLTISAHTSKSAKERWSRANAEV